MGEQNPRSPSEQNPRLLGKHNHRPLGRAQSQTSRRAQSQASWVSTITGLLGEHNPRLLGEHDHFSLPPFPIQVMNLSGQILWLVHPATEKTYTNSSVPRPKQHFRWLHKEHTHSSFPRRKNFPSRWIKLPFRYLHPVFCRKWRLLWKWHLLRKWHRLRSAAVQVARGCAFAAAE